MHSGKVATHKYPEVARQIVAQFLRGKKVAITLRKSLLASHNMGGQIGGAFTRHASIRHPPRGLS